MFFPLIVCSLSSVVASTRSKKAYRVIHSLFIELEGRDIVAANYLTESDFKVDLKFEKFVSYPRIEEEHPYIIRLASNLDMSIIRLPECVGAIDISA